MTNVIDLSIEELELNNEMTAEGYKLTAILKSRDKPYHVVVTEKDGDDSACIYYADINGYNRYTQVVRPKKRKKTFIKTLKELVDSGWTFGEDGCLHFPDSNFAIAPRMSAFLGQEIDYSPSSPQGIWTWTPAMLIEKEV